MNEKFYGICCIAVCFLIAFMVYVFAKLIGKRGAKTNSDRIEDLERRAGEDNRGLSEAERTTRETLERAAETNRRTDELIREQAAVNRRAADNNRRAKELIQRGEEILGSSVD